MKLLLTLALVALTPLCAQAQAQAQTGTPEQVVRPTAAPVAQTSTPAATPPVFRVGADVLDPYERGAALGRQIKARFTDIERLYDAALAGVEASPAQVVALRDALSPARRAEIRGVAEMLELVAEDRVGDGALSLAEFWRVQFLGELAPFAGGVALGADAAGAGGEGPMLARVLDGVQARALAPLAAITIFETIEGGVALIGYAGMLAAPSGVNSDGLAITLIDGPNGQPSTTAPTRAAAFALRDALERETTVSGAARRFALSDFGRGVNVAIADRTRARVLERPRGAGGVLRSGESAVRQEAGWDLPGMVAATSCFVNPTFRGDCRDFRDQIRWAHLRDAAREVSRAAPDIRLADFATRLSAVGDAAGAAAVWAFSPASGDVYYRSGDAGQPLRRLGALITPVEHAAFGSRRRVAWLAAWIAAAAALVAFARFAPWGRRSKTSLRARMGPDETLRGAAK